MGSAPARPDAPALSLAETIDLCLQVAADPDRIESKQRTSMAAEFDPSVTATPAELREQGYTWKAISQLLGVGPTAACGQPNKTPEQLRQQRAIDRRNREIGQARSAGELPRKTVTSMGTIARGPRTGRRGASLAFDPTITATPIQLREQGHTWQGIGQLLGISLTAAYNAAHKAPHKTPAQLRRQAADSRRLRAQARRRLQTA